jgi:hypothetical protein
MPEAQPRVIDCICGSSVFRAYAVAPMMFHISNTEVTFELDSVQIEDLTSLVIHCEACWKSLDLDGVHDEDGKLVDPASQAALSHAFSILLEHLDRASIMEPVVPGCADHDRW